MADEWSNEVSYGEDAFASFKVLASGAFDETWVETQLTRPVVRVPMERPYDKADKLLHAVSKRRAPRGAGMCASNVIANLQEPVIAEDVEEMIYNGERVLRAAKLAS